MVQFEHRSATNEQVLAKQLRVQVSGIFDHVSHDDLFVVQLRYFRYGYGAVTAREVEVAICEDRGTECRFLFLGGLWERVA